MDLDSLAVDALEERQLAAGEQLSLSAPDLWVVLAGCCAYHTRGAAPRQLSPGDLLRVEHGHGRLEARTRSVLLHLQVSVRTAALTKALDGSVTRALRLIEADLVRDWNVPALAKAVGLSRAAFARRFAAHTGRTPARYLRERRLERARQLLWQSDMSVAEIAAEVGYRSEFAFNRAFKRVHSVTPGAFRRSRIPKPSGILCMAA